MLATRPRLLSTSRVCQLKTATHTCAGPSVAKAMPFVKICFFETCGTHQQDRLLEPEAQRPEHHRRARAGELADRGIFDKHERAEDLPHGVVDHSERDKAGDGRQQLDGSDGLPPKLHVVENLLQPPCFGQQDAEGSVE